MMLIGTDEMSEFVIVVKADKGVTPAVAFKSMRKYLVRKGIDAAKVYKRSFKITFHAVNENREDFISRKLDTTTSEDKVFCLPVKEGYVFFGKIYDPIYIS